MSGARAAALAITVREALATDCELIARLHAESWAATYRGMLPAAYLDHGVYGERSSHWRQRLPELLAGAGTVLIAFHEASPCGFVCMEMPDGEGSVYIDNLHARPAVKGQGLGTTLLALAQQWAKARGAKSLNLLVLDSNTEAIGFYESRGWKFCQAEDDTLAGMDIVALRYRLALA